MPIQPMVVDARHVAWPYPALMTLHQLTLEGWLEVAEAFFWENLGVVPPIHTTFGFLVGEESHENLQGEAVYAGFTQIKKRFFARYGTRADHDHHCIALRDSLPTTVYAGRLRSV